MFSNMAILLIYGNPDLKFIKYINFSLIICIGAIFNQMCSRNLQLNLVLVVFVGIPTFVQYLSHI